MSDLGWISSETGPYTRDSGRGLCLLHRLRGLFWPWGLFTHRTNDPDGWSLILFRYTRDGSKLILCIRGEEYE